MDDQTLLARIHDLVEEEHGLRGQLQQGQVGAAEEHARLRDLEEQLDQCWDLLRQRRARREFDQDPDDAQARPRPEVEDYQQ